jgi:hypothetical protein
MLLLVAARWSANPVVVLDPPGMELKMSILLRICARMVAQLFHREQSEMPGTTASDGERRRTTSTSRSRDMPASS